MRDIINLGNELPTLKNVILDPIKRDLINGDAHNQLIAGKPFIGKSNFGFVECLEIDPAFKENLQSRCVFTIPQIIQAQKEKTDMDYRAVFFDEIGDPLGNRTTMTAEQRRYVVLKQADRIKSMFIPQTIPYTTMADKGIRMLSHSIAEGITKNKKKKRAKFSFKINTWKVNYKNKDPIYRFPVVKQNDSFKRITAVWVRKAPNKYWHIYEKLKLENLDRITEKVITPVRMSKEILSDQIVINKIRELVDKEPGYFINELHRTRYLSTPNLSQALRKENMPISQSRIDFLKRIIEKEMGIGYNIKLPPPTN